MIEPPQLSGATSSKNQRRDSQHQKDEKADLGQRRCISCDAAEAKECGQNRNHKQTDRPSKHEILPFPTAEDVRNPRATRTCDLRTLAERRGVVLGDVVTRERA